MTPRRGLPAGSVVAALAALAMLSAVPPASAGDAKGQVARSVVEFFTSQGCASCPPADAIIERLADEPGILALAYHVDYWDYIGWRDTYGSRENSDRQRSYSETFGNAAIYTPQAIVDGRVEMTGSHEKKLRAALEGGPLSRHAPDTKVTLDLADGRLHIAADAGSVPAAGPMPVLMLVTYDDRRDVQILRGANRDLLSRNVHAVHDWRVLGMWSGQPMAIDIPVTMLEFPGTGRVGAAAILQSVTEAGTPGPILAASWVEWERHPENIARK